METQNPNAMAIFNTSLTAYTAKAKVLSDAATDLAVGFGDVAIGALLAYSAKQATKAVIAAKAHAAGVKVNGKVIAANDANGALLIEVGRILHKEVETLTKEGDDEGIADAKAAAGRLATRMTAVVNSGTGMGAAKVTAALTKMGVRGVSESIKACRKMEDAAKAAKAAVKAEVPEDGVETATIIVSTTNTGYLIGVEEILGRITDPTPEDTDHLNKVAALLASIIAKVGGLVTV